MYFLFECNNYWCITDSKISAECVWIRSFLTFVNACCSICIHTIPPSRHILYLATKHLLYDNHACHVSLLPLHNDGISATEFHSGWYRNNFYRLCRKVHFCKPKQDIILWTGYRQVRQLCVSQFRCWFVTQEITTFMNFKTFLISLLYDTILIPPFSLYTSDFIFMLRLQVPWCQFQCRI